MMQNLLKRTRLFQPVMKKAVHTETQFNHLIEIQTITGIT